jgi:hypothetical protein
MPHRFQFRSKRPIHLLDERTWRHPLKEDLVVPCKSAAAIAVMQMGISDLLTIALAINLDPTLVEAIDSAEDPLIRQLAVEGIPDGEFFKLRARVTCPKCKRSVLLAPCLACVYSGRQTQTSLLES